VDLLDANPNWSVYRIIKIYGRAGNLVCSVYDISFSCLKLMRFLCEHFIHLTKKCRPFDDKYSFYVMYEAVIHDISYIWKLRGTSLLNAKIRSYIANSIIQTTKHRVNKLQIFSS
jgi:hypothetical protein